VKNTTDKDKIPSKNTLIRKIKSEYPLTNEMLLMSKKDKVEGEQGVKNKIKNGTVSYETVIYGVKKKKGWCCLDQNLRQMVILEWIDTGQGPAVAVWMKQKQLEGNWGDIMEKVSWGWEVRLVRTFCHVEKRKRWQKKPLIGRKQSFVGGGGGGKNNIKTAAKVHENSRASKVV